MKQWDKAAVYRLLTERGIWHEITEHQVHRDDGFGERPQRGRVPRVLRQ